MKILLVDDDSSVRRLLNKFLLDQGHDVVEADNASSGLREIQRNKIDFVISEIKMPDMNGLDFLSQLRADPKTQDMPFLLCSAVSDPAVVQRGLALGICGYILKPIKKKAFLNKVSQVEIDILKQEVREKKRKERLNERGPAEESSSPSTASAPKTPDRLTPSFDIDAIKKGIDIDALFEDNDIASNDSPEPDEDDPVSFMPVLSKTEDSPKVEKKDAQGFSDGQQLWGGVTEEMLNQDFAPADLVSSAETASASDRSTDEADDPEQYVPIITQVDRTPEGATTVEASTSPAPEIEKADDPEQFMPILTQVAPATEDDSTEVSPVPSSDPEPAEQPDAPEQFMPNLTRSDPTADDDASEAETEVSQPPAVPEKADDPEDLVPILTQVDAEITPETAVGSGSGAIADPPQPAKASAGEVSGPKRVDVAVEIPDPVVQDASTIVVAQGENVPQEKAPQSEQNAAEVVLQSIPAESRAGPEFVEQPSLSSKAQEAKALDGAPTVPVSLESEPRQAAAPSPSISETRDNIETAADVPTESLKLLEIDRLGEPGVAPDEEEKVSESREGHGKLDPGLAEEETVSASVETPEEDLNEARAECVESRAQQTHSRRPAGFDLAADGRSRTRIDIHNLFVEEEEERYDTGDRLKSLERAANYIKILGSKAELEQYTVFESFALNLGDFAEQVDAHSLKDAAFEAHEELHQDMKAVWSRHLLKLRSEIDLLLEGRV